MKKSIKILLPILVLSLILPVLVNDVQQVSAAPYYGSVDFSGTVYLNWSNEEVGSVKVSLNEDGSPKRTDYTDSNGYYEFTWTVVQYKFYSISIEKDGYKG